MTTQSCSQSGPFLVITTRPCPEGHTEPLMQGDGSGWDGASHHTPPCEVCGDHCEVSTSHAIATLADATQYIVAALPEEIGLPRVCIALAKQIVALDVSGGSVGPLPDGTLFLVQPTTHHALWHAVPWNSGHRGGPYMETDGEQNIAGFNAYQEACRVA